MNVDLKHQALIRHSFERNRAIWGDAQMSIAPPEPTLPVPTPAPATDPPAEPVLGPNGFPLNTKPSDMTADHRAAYWQHKARQNEDTGKAAAARVKELEPLAEQIKALEDASQSEAEKAIRKATEDGQKAGREAALAEARKTYGSQLVTVRLETAAAGKGMTVEAMTDLAGSPERFLGESGVDDEALTRFLAALPDKTTPAVPAPLVPGDLGGGQRSSATSATGADLYAQRHPKSTT